jgi:hypothetical protein
MGDGMTLTEWVLFFAIIDGPIVGLIYFLWRKYK